MKGRAIIVEVLRQRHVRADEFFGPSHARYLVSARRVAAKRLAAAGFRVNAIARLMKRNHSSITYWLRPGYRERRSVYYAAYHKAKRAAAVAPMQEIAL